MNEQELRAEIVTQARAMNALGINQGTSGNISVRWADGMLITPSATPYDSMRPEDIVAVDFSGAWQGTTKPSTEWRFHLDILQTRVDAQAVVHTHATFCTTLSIARREIPAYHYMIAQFGGDNVRCAQYADFGTAELAANALRALKDRNACLLANHGMIVMGPSLAKAMWLAVELETLARTYYYSLLMGGGVLLTRDEVAAAARSFEGYGLKN